MKLRELELKDAPLMLEWMHDESVVKDLQANFASKTIEDCNNFINSSIDKTHNIHMAIANDDDIYIGTVSLKNIHNNIAEFAITIRKQAMGKGYSQYGMHEIIRLGFEEFGLEHIYWCVAQDNKRACKFYDKQEFDILDKNHKLYQDVLNNSGYSKEQINRYNWYMVNK